MVRLAIANLVFGVTLGAASLAMAAGPAINHGRTAPSPPAKSQAFAASNGKVGGDRDKGLARAGDRRSSKSLHTTHGHKHAGKHALSAKTHP